jgi:hypothetical protein
MGPAGAKSHINLAAYVNRTPITGTVRAYREKGKLDLYGCGLSHEIRAVPKGGTLDIAFNITTPFSARCFGRSAVPAMCAARCV